jgi:hypothetical protein
MPSISGNNTIVLRARYSQGAAEHEEGVGSGALLPGMNVVLAKTASVMGRDTYIAGSTGAVGTGTNDVPAAAPVRVVKENAALGRTVFDAYASGDNVRIHKAVSGEVLQVLVASGQNLGKSVGVAPNATGKWVANVTAAAAETLESTGGALGADTLVRVEIL